MCIFYRAEKKKFKKLQREVDKMAALMKEDDDDEEKDDEDAEEKEESEAEESESEESESGESDGSDSETEESEPEVNPLNILKKNLLTIRLNENISRMLRMQRRKKTLNHALNGMKVDWQHLKKEIYCDRLIWIVLLMKLINYVMNQLHYNKIWTLFYQNWVK